MNKGAPVRNAAVLVLIDTSANSPRVLVGRRHGGMAFMANKVVFPGGRVEIADHRLSLPVCLAPDTVTALGHRLGRRAAPTLPRALALAAIRETAEEAGLLLAHTPVRSSETPLAPFPAAILTRSAGWRQLLGGGHVPAIDRLHYFARAITPPGRSRRFDTRFFLANACHLAPRAAQGANLSTDGELGDVGWLNFDEARKAEMAPITRTVLDEAELRLDELANGRMGRPLPFFHTANRKMVKDWIPAR